MNLNMMLGMPLQGNQQEFNPISLAMNPQSQSTNSSMFSVGLSQLQAHVAKTYPSETFKPLLLRPNKSFLMGGSEPLDYIYIFKNEEDQARKIPRHWHYIGFGLSDVHGYAMFCYMDSINRANNPNYASTIQTPVQLYPLPGTTSEKLSGFGFELTFRIKCDSNEAWNSEPPRWPAHVMQALSRYVFQSKNVFNVGDHTAWLCSLDGNDESRIEHMLMALDPQLKDAETVWGKVRFIQLVGVCHEELQAARRWNVKGILSIMKEREETGGTFLVTDMRRGQSIFELDANNLDLVDSGISRDGSDMTSMSVKHKFSYSVPKWFTDVEKRTTIDEDVEIAPENNRVDAFEANSERDNLNDDDKSVPNTSNEVERGNFFNMDYTETQKQLLNDFDTTRNPSRMSFESESALMIENAELMNVRYYDSVYLLLSYESARILPVVLNGRLAFRQPFTYKSFKGDLLTTFVPEGSASRSLVTKERPFGREGPWLQIFVTEELRQQMLDLIMSDFHEDVEGEPNIRLPKNYSWPEYKLYITVVDEIKD